MSDDQPKETRWIRFKESFDYETRRMEGVIVQPTSVGAIHLLFYVERPAFEQRFEAEVLANGRLGKTVSVEKEKEKETVVEVQQGILLDVHTARQLRTTLNIILGEENPQDAHKND